MQWQWEYCIRPLTDKTIYISLLLSTQIWKNWSPPIELTTQIKQNSIQFFCRLAHLSRCSTRTARVKKKWKQYFFLSSIHYVCGTSRRIRIVRAHSISHLAELFYMRRNPIVVVAQRFRFLFVSFISRSRSFSAIAITYMITLFVGAFFAVRIFALLCSHRVAIDADISVQCDDDIHPHHCDPIVWPMHRTTFLHGFAAWARVHLSPVSVSSFAWHCRTGVKAAGETASATTMYWLVWY